MDIDEVLAASDSNVVPEWRQTQSMQHMKALAAEVRRLRALYVSDSAQEPLSTVERIDEVNRAFKAQGLAGVLLTQPETDMLLGEVNRLRVKFAAVEAVGNKIEYENIDAWDAMDEIAAIMTGIPREPVAPEEEETP